MHWRTGGVALQFITEELGLVIIFTVDYVLVIGFMVVDVFVIIHWLWVPRCSLPRLFTSLRSCDVNFQRGQ